MTGLLYSEIWESYTACWSNPNENIRKEILIQLLTPDCFYADPNIEITGIGNLSYYMEQFQKDYAGASFVTSEFKAHHNQSLSLWKMVNAENTVLNKGASFAMYRDNKLCKITGFFSN